MSTARTKLPHEVTADRACVARSNRQQAWLSPLLFTTQRAFRPATTHPAATRAQNRQVCQPAAMTGLVEERCDSHRITLGAMWKEANIQPMGP